MASFGLVGCFQMELITKSFPTPPLRGGGGGAGLAALRPPADVISHCAMRDTAGRHPHSLELGRPRVPHRPASAPSDVPTLTLNSRSRVRLLEGPGPQFWPRVYGSHAQRATRAAQRVLEGSIIEPSTIEGHNSSQCELSGGRQCVRRMMRLTNGRDAHCCSRCEHGVTRNGVAHCATRCESVVTTDVPRALACEYVVPLPESKGLPCPHTSYVPPKQAR